MAITHLAETETEKPTRGHLIVEPLRHIVDFAELTEDETNAFGKLIKTGAGLLKDKLGAEHVYLFRINDKVNHLHFHLIPRYPNTPKEFWGAKIIEWPGRNIANLAEIAKVVKILSR